MGGARLLGEAPSLDASCASRAFVLARSGIGLRCNIARRRCRDADAGKAQRLAPFHQRTLSELAGTAALHRSKASDEAVMATALPATLASRMSR